MEETNKILISDVVILNTRLVLLPLMICHCLLCDLLMNWGLCKEALTIVFDVFSINTFFCLNWIKKFLKGQPIV